MWSCQSLGMKISFRGAHTPLFPSSRLQQTYLAACRTSAFTLAYTCDLRAEPSKGTIMRLSNTICSSRHWRSVGYCFSSMRAALRAPRPHLVAFNSGRRYEPHTTFILPISCFWIE